MRGRILYGTKKFREDAISFLFLVGGEGEKFYTVLKSFGIGGYFRIFFLFFSRLIFPVGPKIFPEKKNEKLDD